MSCEATPFSVQTIVSDRFKFDVLRLDLIHPHFGGNKIFKLKRNVARAKEQGFDSILTFGGPHSNHIFATAAYCLEQNIRCVGVIRGEDHADAGSPTLQFAAANGMKLHFISRSMYRRKNPALMEELAEKFGKFYLIPEGGSNLEGVEGCMEIGGEKLSQYGYIFCACGTAATFAGIRAAAAPHQKVVGISVLKGENRLTDVANGWLEKLQAGKAQNYCGGKLTESVILDAYHMGGYASCSPQLLSFKTEFERSFGIPLDHLYTAKLFYGVFDLAEKGCLLPDAPVLIVHSGGLQGNAAFEERYHLKPTR